MVVWEDPPAGSASIGRGRAKSQLRMETDELLEELRANPGRWARLWDFDSQEDARKRQGFAQRKGWGFAIRYTDKGWSVFGRFRDDDPSKAETRAPTF
jgi:hypothetical protein